MLRLLNRVSNSLSLQALVLVTLAFAIYGFSFQNQFVMDDEDQIVQNRLTESLDHLPQILMGSSVSQSGGSQTYGVYFRPLMIAAFAVIRSNFGLDPAPFHIFQLLLHIANAFFLILLFRRFMPNGYAFTGGVLFLVHPMNVEAVCYIASLQDPLCVVFGLAALVTITRIKRFTWVHAAATAVLFFLSLLSKETGALLVFASLLFVFFFQRALVMKVLSSSVVAVSGYLALRIGVAGLTQVSHTSTQLARAPFADRLFTLPLILLSYLSKFVAPVELVINQDWLVTSPEFLRFWLPLVLVLVIACACSAYAWKKDLSPFTYFFVWAFAALGLHSHLIEALDGTVAERWFYVPCMALLGMALTFASDYRALLYVRSPRLTLTILVALTAIFSVRSYARTRDWSEGYVLFAQDVEKQPDSAHLQNNYGVELFRHGRVQEAQERFKKSVELNPYWTISWNNLGATYQRAGDLARAQECYAKSISLGSYLLADQNFAGILIQTRHDADAEQFLLTSALKRFPDDVKLNDFLRYIRSEKSSGH